MATLSSLRAGISLNLSHGSRQMSFLSSCLRWFCRTPAWIWQEAKEFSPCLPTLAGTGLFNRRLLWTVSSCLSCDLRRGAAKAWRWWSDAELGPSDERVSPCRCPAVYFLQLLSRLLTWDARTASCGVLPISVRCFQELLSEKSWHFICFSFYIRR
jgi:hypothetical protein